MYAQDGGNLDVALQLAQTAKQKLPDVHAVDDTLGFVYYKKDLPTLAIPAFERAVQKDPKNASYYHHLGMAYLKAGNKPAAKRALETALKLQPDLPEAPAIRQALAPL
jgi:tetratricopeptide (TPR) repeat protein